MLGVRLRVAAVTRGAVCVLCRCERRKPRGSLHGAGTAPVAAPPTSPHGEGANVRVAPRFQRRLVGLCVVDVVQAVVRS